jgi:hypothetical protein
MKNKKEKGKKEKGGNKKISGVMNVQRQRH